MNRPYTTSSGEELQVSRVSSIAVQRIEIEWKKRKPKPPLEEVERAGRTATEPNPNNPEYLESLEIWESEKNIAVMKYLYTAGVHNRPPEEFIEAHREFFPEADPQEMKFLWLTSIIAGEEETANFMEFIMGQTMVTEGGVKSSEERFPSDGQREADRAVPVPGVANSGHPDDTGV